MLIPVQATANSEQSFAPSSATVYDDRIVLDYASAGELNQSLLDDNQPLQVVGANFGYWSEFISKTDGTFTTNPIVTYQFKYAHRFNSIKITFTDYVLEFKASFWLNGTKLYENTYKPTEKQLEVVGNVTQYNKFIIEAIKILPQRFFKISKLEFSADYNNAIFKPDRQLTGRVYFSLVDPAANADCTPSDNGVKVGNINYTLDEVRYVEQYATIGELNQALLDTSQLSLPPDYSNINLGFWSSYFSKLDGTFTTNPKLTYSFSQLHSVAGITLLLNNYVLECKLTFYNNNAIVKQQTFAGLTNKELQLLIDVQNFNKLEVEIIKILPNSYFKLLEILFGIEYKYENNKYIKFEILEELDPTGAEITSNELTLDLNNIDGQFDIYNPNSQSKYLQELQPLHAEIDVKIDDKRKETIKLGTFYLNNWQMLSDNTLRLTAYDLIYQMEQPYRKSKFYNNETVENILLDLFRDINLFDIKGNPLFTITDEIKQVRLTGYIPIKTQREALSDICLAANAECKVNRNGIVEVYRLNPLDVPYISIGKDISQYPKSELLESRKALAIKYYSYATDTTQQTLFEGNITGNVIIEYSTPNATNVTVTGSYASFTAYANAIEIIGASGNIVIKGNVIKTNETETIITNAATYKNSEITELNENYLITSNNFQSVGNWLLPYIEKRIKQNIKWWADPKVDIGKNILIENRYDNYTNGIIIKNHYIVRNGLSTETEVLT